MTSDVLRPGTIEDHLRRRTMGWVILSRPLSPARETACRKILGRAPRGLLAGAAKFHLGLLEAARGDIDAAVAAGEPLAKLWRAHLALSENDPAAAKTLAEGDESAWGRCLYGEALLRLGDKEGAARSLERSLRLDKKRAWAHVLLSEAHRDLKRFDLAEKDLDAAVRLEKSSWAHAIRGRTGFNFRDKKKALADLNKALALDPSFMEGYAYRAEALRRVGKLEESLRDFNKVLSSGLPGMQRIQSWRGALLAQLGRLKEAEIDLTADIDVEEEPNIAWQLAQRARVRLRQGRLREAVDDMNRAARINPKSGWIFGVGGREGGTLDKCGEVVAELAKAIKKDPRWPWGWAWRGETLARAGRFKEALGDLEKAIRLAPKEGWFRAWRGLARQGLGDTEKAAADFEKSIELAPSYAPAYGWRAHLHMRRGEFARARPFLDKLLSIDPLCSWAYAWRGECLLKTGDVEAARGDLETAVNLDNAYADAWAWLAEARRRKGELQAALEAVERAAALGGDKGLCHLVRGMVRGDLGDGRGRIRDFEKAERARPELFAGRERTDRHPPRGGC